MSPTADGRSVGYAETARRNTAVVAARVSAPTAAITRNADPRTVRSKPWMIRERNPSATQLIGLCVATSL